MALENSSQGEESEEPEACTTARNRCWKIWKIIAPRPCSQRKKPANKKKFPEKIDARSARLQKKRVGTEQQESIRRQSNGAQEKES